MIEVLEALDRVTLVQHCREHLSPSRDTYIVSLEQRFGRKGEVHRTNLRPNQTRAGRLKFAFELKSKFSEAARATVI